MAEKLAILVTASIDPKGMIYTARSDPKIREHDYEKVLLELLHKTNLPIIFCENSGYNLSRLQSVAEKTKSGQVTFLQFNGQKFPREKGKGYGEMLIINYALHHSSILQSADLIIKITGRYSVENLNEILKEVEDKENISAFADFRKEARYTYTGFFGASPEFFTKYLLPKQEDLDDSKKQTMEVIFQRALLEALNDNKKILLFTTKPIISGISGTWNVGIAEGNYMDIKMSWPKFKIIVKAYWQAGLKRLKRAIVSNHE